jgi:hypothetical protein
VVRYAAVTLDILAYDPEVNQAVSELRLTRFRGEDAAGKVKENHDGYQRRFRTLAKEAK